MAKSKGIPAVSKTRTRSLHVLFTCVGRRIELVNAFRRAAERVGFPLILHGADVNWTAPAMHSVDYAHIVPRIDAEGHLNALLRIVRYHRIDMVIPLIDSDLLMLAKAKSRFARNKAHVVISDESVIEASSDKVLTFEALRKAGIDTPKTWLPKELAKKKTLDFPLFIKPRFGSAGKGLFKVSDREELEVLLKRVDKPIIQEFIKGTEFTLDVFAGLDGKVRCIVPRKRLEVRSGEVSKGMVVKHPKLIELGRQVVESMDHCEGVITVQCISTTKSHRGRIAVIEVNPRFGGGAPLSIQAGADFPYWLMQEYMGRQCRGYMNYQDNMLMLRYDQSIFLDDPDAYSIHLNKYNKGLK